MKYKIIVLLAALLLILVGCQNDEEKIKSLMLSDLEERYYEKFEIVDFNYNKANHFYEAGVQTEKTKAGYAAEVTYSPDDGVFDEYYTHLYCIEVTNELKKLIELSDDYYMYTMFPISIVTPREVDISYDSFVTYADLENTVINCYVYFPIGSKELEEVREKITNAAMGLDNPNCNISIYFVSEETISDVKYFITNHYKIYDDDKLSYDWDEQIQIKKRDGKIL